MQKPSWSDEINDAKSRFRDYQKKYTHHDNPDNISNPQISNPFSSPVDNHGYDNFPNDQITQNHGVLEVTKIQSSAAPLGHVDTINVLLVERNHLKRHLTVLNKQTQDIKDENLVLTKEKENLLIKIEELTLLNNSVSLKAKSLQTNLDLIESEYHQNKASLVNYESKCRSLEYDANELKGKLQSKVEECKNLKNLNESLNKEKLFSPRHTNVESDLITNLTHQLELNKKRIDSREEELLRLNQIYANQRENNNILTKKIVDLEEQNKEYVTQAQEEIKRINKENKVLFNEVERLKTLSSVATSKTLDLPRRNDELSAIIQQKNFIIDDLMRRCKNSENQNQDRKVLLEKLQSDRDVVSRCVDQNTKLKEILSKQDLMIEKMAKEKEQLTSQLNCKTKKDSTSLSFIDLHEHIAGVYEQAYQLRDYTIGINQLAAKEKHGISHEKLNHAYEELKSTISIYYTKNEELKKLNAMLCQTTDDYCLTIKEQDKIIINLKEKLSFIKMEESVNKEDHQNGTKEACLLIETHDIINSLKEENNNLVLEAENLKNQINQLKISGTKKILKNELYAELERQFNRLKHDKSLIESRLEEEHHKNILLAEECNTIGEYIHLYVTKRTAMKLSLETIFQFLFDLQINMAQLYDEIIKAISFLPLILDEQSIPSKSAEIKNVIEKLDKTLYDYLYQLTFHESLNIVRSFLMSKNQFDFPWIQELSNRGYSLPKKEH